MAKRTPRVFLNVFNYFIESLKPRKIRGDHIGTDYLGNKYFELPADPSRGKRKPRRWFQSTTGESGFDSEKPSEWESWLRHRRNEPPTEEEIQKNLAIAEMKKKNAALLEQQANIERGGAIITEDAKGRDSYPKYEEYTHHTKK